MKVYEIANDLVSEIRNTDEYKNMIKLQEELEKNKTIKDMLFDFSNAQMQLNSKHMSGQQVTEDDIMVVQEKYDELNKYPLAKYFFDTQIKYTNMMNEISRIINGE